MTEQLRDKIAWAMFEAMEDTETGPLSDSSIVDVDIREDDLAMDLFESADDELPLLSIDLGQLAGAVLAVLDDVRADAWEQGFDAGQSWESDMNSRVIPSASRQDNPYRRAEQ